MKLWRIVALALCLVMLFALGACSQTKTEEPAADATVEEAKPADGKSYVVGVSMATTTNNPYLMAISEDITRQFEEQGWTVIMQDADMDATKQSTQMDNLITQEVDLIVYWAQNASAAVADAKKAYDAGIPVINFFVQADPEAEQYMNAYVGVSQKASGAAIAEYADSIMGGSGNYVIVDGMQGASDFVLRVEGIEEVFGDRYVQLANEYTSSDRVNAQSVMENFMTVYPDIDFVILPEDMSGMGAYEAIAEAGKLGDIKIFGIGGTSDEVFNHIREGNIEATIDMGLEKFGQKLVEVIKAIQAGETVEYDQTLDIVLVTKDNINEFYPE
jgi:ABC-type sugar transport system substrate-binding protein